MLWAGSADGWPTFAWFWQMWVFSAEHPHISSLRSQMWATQPNPGWTRFWRGPRSG